MLRKRQLIGCAILYCLSAVHEQARSQRILTGTSSRERAFATKLSELEPSYSQRLFADLFKNYKVELRPVIEDAVAVNVTMHVWFKQVLKMDEVNQVLTLYCWVEEYWNDELLRWNPEDYGGISALILPTNRVWKPDILVYNNAEMNIRENELMTNLVVNHTGQISSYRSIITRVTCKLDMTYFPFDSHCFMLFSSLSYDSGQLYLISRDASDNLRFYIENTEWTLMSFRVERNIQYYDCCPKPYTEVIYKFELRRNSLYYILNLIIPSAFITVITVVGFFTPYSSTGENTEKISIGVSALLSIALRILIMIADRMPATSNIVPLIGKYYIGLIWIIVSGSCVTALTLRLQSKGYEGKPLSPEVKHFFFDWVAKLVFVTVRVSRAPIPPLRKSQKPSALVSSLSETSASVKRLETALHARSTMRLSKQCVINSARYRAATATASKRSSSAAGSRIRVVPYRSAPTQNPSTSKLSSNRPPPIRGLFARCRDEIFSMLERLCKSMENFDRRVALEERNELIRAEWEQLARICERLLMIVFISVTVIFAMYMVRCALRSRRRTDFLEFSINLDEEAGKMLRMSYKVDFKFSD